MTWRTSWKIRLPRVVSVTKKEEEEAWIVASKQQETIDGGFSVSNNWNKERAVVVMKQACKKKVYELSFYYFKILRVVLILYSKTTKIGSNV